MNEVNNNISINRDVVVDIIQKEYSFMLDTPSAISNILSIAVIFALMLKNNKTESILLDLFNWPGLNYVIKRLML